MLRREGSRSVVIVERRLRFSGSIDVLTLGLPEESAARRQ